jgi:hypothetical protein
LQVGSIWISYLIAVVVLFFFAIGFAKLYQHRTEKDGFVTTVTVLAITTVNNPPSANSPGQGGNVW